LKHHVQNVVINKKICGSIYSYALSNLICFPINQYLISLTAALLLAKQQERHPRGQTNLKQNIKVSGTANTLCNTHTM